MPDQDSVPDLPLWRRVWPLAGSSYSFGLGVQPLDPPSPTERTPAHDAEMKLKRAIDADPRRTTFAELEGTREAQEEAAALVAATRPDIAPDPALPSLHAVALCVQEDLLVLQTDDSGVFRLVAGALHFPSAWNLADKLGLDFLAIHGPVPGFSASAVGAASVRFLERLRPDRPVWRTNWTLQAGPRLDLAMELRDEWLPLRNEITPANALSLVHYRTEYQKLFRLPRTGAVLFTIHTVVVPLAEVAAAQPEGGQLLATLRTLDPAIARYKGLTGYLPAVLQALERAVPAQSRNSPR